MNGAESRSIATERPPSRYDRSHRKGAVRLAQNRGFRGAFSERPRGHGDGVPGHRHREFWLGIAGQASEELLDHSTAPAAKQKISTESDQLQ